MKLYQKMEDAMTGKDMDAFMSLLADDYTFVRHQTGTTLDKAGMIELGKYLFDSNSTSVENMRCVYENDDILVEHSVMGFPDGSREAVLAVHTKKGDKIVRTETGATPL